MTPPTPAALLGIGRKIHRSSVADREVNRRGFLVGLAGMCGALAVSGSTACTRPSFHRRVGVSIPYEAEILNEFYSDIKEKPIILTRNSVSSWSMPRETFSNKTIAIELFIAQGFGGVFILCCRWHGSYRRSRAGEGCLHFQSQRDADYRVHAEYRARPAHRWVQRGEVCCTVDQRKTRRQGRSRDIGQSDGLAVMSGTQGLKDGLRQNCPGAVLVGEVEANTVDTGAAAGANLLQAHPNIAVILAFSDDPGVGAYTAALEAGRKDRNRFFVGSADGTRLGMEKSPKAALSVLRLLFLFFQCNPGDSPSGSLPSREKVAPTRIMGSKLVTKENVEEFDRISHNPRAPEWAHFYTDPEVMRYSDVPLTTPE